MATAWEMLYIIVQNYSDADLNEPNCQVGHEKFPRGRTEKQ